jgi:uncharacterized RmlC-like cupin family protein
MFNLVTTNEFSGITDPAYLRAAADALTGLIEEIDQDPDVTSDIPGVDLPRAAGQRAVKAMALRRRQRALTQLARLHRADDVDLRPVVLDPTTLTSIDSIQGQPLTPIITAGTGATAHTRGLSSAKVWMAPGHRSRAHHHDHTDIGVVVIEGTAITLWWDHHGTRHELTQHAGQHLHIPATIPHAAINPHGTPVIALEFRNNPVFNADNHCLPGLDGEVTDRLTAAPATDAETAA